MDNAQKLCHCLGRNLKFLIFTTSERGKEKMDMDKIRGGRIGGDRRDEGRQH